MKLGWIVTAAVLVADAGVAKAAEPVWVDAAALRVEGRGWADVETPYDRLPAHARSKAPQSVWGLSKQSAGIAIRFRTTASHVSVRWSVTSAGLDMPHMPATGVSGVDLYQRTAGGWSFVQNGRPTGAEGNRMTATLLAGPSPAECLLYLPLYNGCRKVEIGVEPPAKLEPAAPRRAGPIVAYGTSITQGGCASRPGMAYTAIVGRMLEREVINLGFSGAGLMEPAVADLLAELDPAVYVIDCLWNMGGLPDAEIEARVQNLARTLRKAHPRTPILFVGQSQIRRDAHPTHPSRVQEEAVRALQAEGVSGLFLLPGSALLTDDEGTVDGCHPNDHGMMDHAKALAPAVKRLLK
jgi:lysophospholipase L1-like esterase